MVGDAGIEPYIAFP